MPENMRGTLTSSDSDCMHTSTQQAAAMDIRPPPSSKGIKPLPDAGNITTSSPSHYPNITLSLTTQSFRLLAFWRDDSGTICGHLDTFETADSPPFMALSYEWGDPQSKRHSILLQGQRFEIRENLFNALQHILDYIENTESDVVGKNSIYPWDRLATMDGSPLQYIWIDFVCVHQENIAERSHQVNIMKEIYFSATLVLAWVGPNSTITTNAMKFLRNFRNSGPSPLHHISDTLAIRGSSLEHFLDLEYFHRMWIVQEIVLAPRLILMCGPDAIDGDVARECILFYHESQKMLTATQAGKILTKRKADETRELGYLMVRFRSSECSDARDRVYALLGLAKQHSAEVAKLRNTLTGISPDEIPDLGFSRYVSADYGLSPFELWLKLINCALLEHDVSLWNAAQMRMSLRIPNDLIIPFDKAELEVDESSGAIQKVTWRPKFKQKIGFYLFDHTLYEGYHNRKKRRTKGAASKHFLAQVRSMDWSTPDSWFNNYQALQLYSFSCPSSFLNTLEDLERYWVVHEWAAATLQAPGVSQTEESYQARREVRKAVYKQLEDCTILMIGQLHVVPDKVRN